MVLNSPYSQFFNELLAWANQLPEPKRSTALQTISVHPMGSALLRARGEIPGPPPIGSPPPPNVAPPGSILSGMLQLRQQGLSPQEAALASWRLANERWKRSPQGQAVQARIAKEMEAERQERDADLRRAEYLISRARPLPAAAPGQWDRFTRANVDQDMQVHAQVQRELEPLDARIRQLNEWQDWNAKAIARRLPVTLLPPAQTWEQKQAAEQAAWQTRVDAVNAHAEPLLAQLRQRQLAGELSPTSLYAMRRLPRETPQQAAARQRMEAAEKVRRQAWQNIAAARAENRRMRLGEPTNPILQAIVNYGPDAAALMYQKEFVEAQRQHQLELADKQGQWEVKAAEAQAQARAAQNKPEEADDPFVMFFTFQRQLRETRPDLKTFDQQFAEFERVFPEHAARWKERARAVTGGGGLPPQTMPSRTPPQGQANVPPHGQASVPPQGQSKPTPGSRPSTNPAAPRPANLGPPMPPSDTTLTWDPRDYLASDPKDPANIHKALQVLIDKSRGMIPVTPPDMAEIRKRLMSAGVDRFALQKAIEALDVDNQTFWETAWKSLLFQPNRSQARFLSESAPERNRRFLLIAFMKRLLDGY